MTHAPEVQKLLANALDFEVKLAFANSDVAPHEPTDGGRRNARLEVVRRWDEWEAALEAAKPHCPIEVIALRTAMANALHQRMQVGIKPARDAVEAAACPRVDTAKSSTSEIPDEFRTRVVNKTEAAKLHAGRKIENGTDYFKPLIEQGLVKAPIGKGKNWRFDIRDFPASAHDKLRLCQVIPSDS